MITSTATRLGAVALVALGVLAAAGSADAATSASEAATTWSVRPAGAEGADGRAWVEVTLDPGDRVTEYMEIVNHSGHAVDFSLNSADGYFTERGRFNMLASDAVSTGSGTWIEIDDSIRIPAGESAVVPFTITVPQNATPGDHAAGVAASIVSAAEGASGAVGVESRVGFRVITRVTGQLSPVLLLSGEARYEGSWNPFERGSMVIDIQIVNDGNVRLGADSQIVIAGPFGSAQRSVEAFLFSDSLPGDTRTARIEVPGAMPLGRLVGDIRVTPIAVDGDHLALELEPVDVRVVAWAVPWSQGLVLGAVLMLAHALRLGLLRRRRRLDAMLAAAREEGRREAGAATSAERDGLRDSHAARERGGT